MIYEWIVVRRQNGFGGPICSRGYLGNMARLQGIRQTVNMTCTWRVGYANRHGQPVSHQDVVNIEKVINGTTRK